MTRTLSASSSIWMGCFNLADFDKHLREITADLGWPDGFTSYDQTHRYSTDHLPSSDRKEARRRINQPGFFADLPPVGVAVAGMKDLAEVADVWVVSKPLEANPTCRDDKARWLVEHIGKGWDRRLIMAPDKSLIIGDLLLDDAPKPEWFDRAVWRPVIYPWSFNGPDTEWDGLPRWQWRQPVSELLDLIEDPSTEGASND